MKNVEFKNTENLNIDKVEKNFEKNLESVNIEKIEDVMQNNIDWENDKLQYDLCTNLNQIFAQGFAEKNIDFYAVLNKNVQTLTWWTPNLNLV